MNGIRGATCRNAILAGLLPVLGACATTSTPIPVVGDEPDLAILDGRWEGNYESPETGRSGSITFELTAGRDTAYGDVIMVPSSGPHILQSDEHGEGAAPAPPMPLEISFVRAEAGAQISGALTPYQDPACACVLRTRFEGHVEGDTIRGDYFSTHSGSGQVQSGTFTVVRKHE